MLIAHAESEQAHRMKCYRSRIGTSFGQHWRNSNDGGFFMYEMTCSPDIPLAVAVRYRQDDSGPRMFDLQIDGQTIHTFNHHQAMSGVEKPLYYEEIPIPEGLTKGKQTITVKFNTHNHNMAGGIFYLRLITR